MDRIIGAIEGISEDLSMTANLTNLRYNIMRFAKDDRTFRRWLIKMLDIQVSKGRATYKKAFLDQLYKCQDVYALMAFLEEVRHE